MIHARATTAARARVAAALVIMVTAALALAAGPVRGAPLLASQSLGVFREGGGSGVPGRSLVSYTSVGTRWTHWRVRGALSWWRWSPDAGTGGSDEAAPGALNLTVGRRLWSSAGPGRASRGWLQVSGAVPLTDTPSPVGSGAFDWGASLLATNRVGAFLLLAEAGYTDPGNPVGLAYVGRPSAAVSASWRRPGMHVYPVASYLVAGPVVDGGPGYGEWSAGLGALLGGRTGLLALYSRGTTAGSPDHGFTTVLTVRL